MGSAVGLRPDAIIIILKATGTTGKKILDQEEERKQAIRARKAMKDEIKRELEQEKESEKN